MSSGPLITIPGPAKTIVPTTPGAKTIVSGPGVALAALTSPRRLPSPSTPLSRVLETVKVWHGPRFLEQAGGGFAIGEVAVVAQPDETTGERACAVVVLAEGYDSLTIPDLAEHCSARGLARQKVPERLEIVVELPRNPIGKVLKRELRERYSGLFESA